MREYSIEEINKAIEKRKMKILNGCGNINAYPIQICEKDNLCLDCKMNLELLQMKKEINEERK